jgi:hypothetical protein
MTATAIRPKPTIRCDRLTRRNERSADEAFYHMQCLRDELVHANERVAAEHVESAIQSLQDACRALLRRAAA